MITNTNQSRNFSVIKKQNLFEIINKKLLADHNGNSVVVPHVCNNVNAFGAGFAGQVASLYPEVKANFHLLGHQAKLGHTQFVTVGTNKKYNHQLIFANMVSQNKLISTNNKRPLHYGALVYSMNNVRSYIKNLEKIYPDANKIEIHAPKFGSGLAGGNWNFIADLIEDIWFDIPVFIYTFK